MNKIFSTLFSAARAKLTALWTKIRLWTSPTFWKTKGITKLRGFFSKLFDIKPRNKKDYYPVFRWLVSKRLAFAGVIALAVLCLYFIFVMSPVTSLFSDAKASIRTYKYNSIPLKYYSGTVQILAADGYSAFVGNVDSGACTGTGKLYNSDGSLVYEGEFQNNMYNGTGKQYYPDGTVQYDGEFTDNLFNGQGSSFRQNGSLAYVGSHAGGLRAGAGELYNSGSNLIFSGNFRMDHLLYEEFVGKTAPEAAALYTGASAVYSSEDEYCVEMKEINAVYAAESGANSLDEAWTVSGIYVLSSSFPVAADVLTNVDELTAYFGQPNYFGSTWVILPEAVAINLLASSGESAFGAVDMEMTYSFDSVYDVSEYDQNYEIYIYSYEMDGLIYTFYCSDSTSGFLMYSIEAA